MVSKTVPTIPGDAGRPGRVASSIWRQPFLRQRIIATGFLISACVLAFLFVIAYQSNKEFVRWNKLAMHTRDVLQALDGYATAVKNAQVAALDFYTNGSETQVHVFSAAESQGRGALVQVGQLSSDNPTQLRNLEALRPLADEGFRILGAVIQARRDGKSGPDGLNSVNADAKKVTPPLTNALKSMTAEENRLLAVRSSESVLFARKAKWLQIGGAVLAMLLLWVTYALFVRETSFRAKAELELSHANSQLESRIAQRTSELESALLETRNQSQERLAAEAAVTRLNTELEERVRRRTSELEASNGELEAFSYSVSHDLRAPLRSIDGFSAALLEDYGDRLDVQARTHLQRVRSATVRMGKLIDDLLDLSRISRTDLKWEPMNLSWMAQQVADELRTAEPGRDAEFIIHPGLRASGDPRLVQVMLQNLLSNSWKFTSKRKRARIELGLKDTNGKATFFVRDNGAGFDPAHSSRLFGAFQRLHAESEFPGTGVGLATVQRIIRRHGGEIWAESEIERGATFYFTLQLS